MLKFLVLLHSSESWGDGRATAERQQRVPGAAPQAAAELQAPLHTAQEERHHCLDNWNTFRGQFFTGPPARPFPTIAVLLPRTQSTDQRLFPLPKSPTTPLLDGHTPTHHTPVEHLHTQDTSSTASTNTAAINTHQGNISHQFSPNLSPPSKFLPPMQPQSPSALGSSPALPHRLHVLPCWTASTFF